MLLFSTSYRLKEIENLRENGVGRRFLIFRLPRTIFKSSFVVAMPRGST